MTVSLTKPRIDTVHPDRLTASQRADLARVEQSVQDGNWPSTEYAGKHRAKIIYGVSF